MYLWKNEAVCHSPEEDLVQFCGERGEERGQCQHETTDHRCKPCTSTATRANDQGCRSTGDRSAQCANPRWNVNSMVIWKRPNTWTACWSSSLQCIYQEGQTLLFYFLETVLFHRLEFLLLNNAFLGNFWFFHKIIYQLLRASSYGKGLLYRWGNEILRWRRELLSMDKYLVLEGLTTCYLELC